MTFTNMVLIGVALFAIVGAIGAFTIAFRRSQGEDVMDPTGGLSVETLKADRSMAGVRVEPIVTEVEVESVPEIEIEIPEAEETISTAVQVVEIQRVLEVSAEESGVSRRQFFNRALGGTFFTFLGLQGVYYLAFFWPKLSGGFGSDVDAGAVADVTTQVFASDGSVLPLFVPEARAYVVPCANALRSVCRQGCRRRWLDGSVPALCPPWMSGPVVRSLAGFRVSMSRIEVQLDR